MNQDTFDNHTGQAFLSISPHADTERTSSYMVQYEEGTKRNRVTRRWRRKRRLCLQSHVLLAGRATSSVMQSVVLHTNEVFPPQSLYEVTTSLSPFLFGLLQLREMLTVVKPAKPNPNQHFPKKKQISA